MTRARSTQDLDLRALADGVYGALNAGDLDRFLTFIAEDVEFTSLVAEAEGTVFRGHAGVRLWWETVRGSFQDPTWELLETRLSEDWGLIQFRLEGVIGGAPVSQTMWQASRLREGKITWWAFFRTEEEALEAAGLPD